MADSSKPSLRLPMKWYYANTKRCCSLKSLKNLESVLDMLTLPPFQITLIQFLSTKEGISALKGFCIALFTFSYSEPYREKGGKGNKLGCIQANGEK